MNMIKTIASRLAIGVSCCASPIPASSQEMDDDNVGSQVEEIVVTAQRVAQGIQKVPLAVTAITGDSLEQRGIRGIEDLNSAVPGLNVATSSVAQPFLRGIGNSSSALGNEASTAVYVDGVYYSRLPVGMFGLNNIERVEVLKGPQGTLFGRNASAGVIQLVTKDPKDVSVKGGVSYGRRNYFDGNFYASSPISDTLAADISVAGQKFIDGYGHNDTLDIRSGYVDYFIARSKWLFIPSDTTRATLSGFYSRTNVDTQGNVLPGFIAGYSSDPRGPLLPLDYYDQRKGTKSFNITKSYGVTLKVEQDLGSVNLISTTAYMKMVLDQVSDADYSERDDMVIIYGGPVKQFTQEFLARSANMGSLQWQVGAFYFRARSEYDDKTFFYSPDNTVPSYLGSEGFISTGYQVAKSYALFGQATYQIVEGLKATGGLRYSMDRLSADGIIIRGNGGVYSDPPAASDKLNKLTFRAAIDFQLTDEVLLYASFSRGFKSAVFNILPYSNVPNKPEVLDAYEAGFKTDLFDRRVRLNGAAYHYKLKNPQVQLLTAGSVVLSNAESARVNGAELEMQVAVTGGLRLRASGSYVDSKYTSYSNAPSGPQNPNSPFGSVNPLISIDAKGNYLPFAAKWTTNIGFDHHIDFSGGTLFISGDWAYNSGYYFEPDNLIHQKAFSLVNGQIKYALEGGMSVRLWGRNLLGEKYATRAGSTAGPASFSYVPGQPRMYGVGLDFSF